MTKPKLIGFVLIIGAHNHTHSFIKLYTNVYLNNQMLGQSLTLCFLHFFFYRFTWAIDWASRLWFMKLRGAQVILIGRLIQRGHVEAEFITHNYSHLYIKLYTNVYLTNQMLGQSLTLWFFFLNFTNFITKSYYNMIIIHTHVTNYIYFLIIKLYKFILYLYYTHKHPHTS